MQGSEFYQVRRRLKDRAARTAIASGGVGVILAILLIFLYLVYEIYPLFKRADINAIVSYDSVSSAAPLYLAIEEQGTTGFRIDEQGIAQFFTLTDGDLLSQQELANANVTSFALASEESRVFGLGLASGKVLVAKHEYDTQYTDEGKRVIPRLSYPLGREPRVLAANGQAVMALAVRDDESNATIAAFTDDHLLRVMQLAKEQDFISEEWTFSERVYEWSSVGFSVTELLLSPNQRFLFALGNESQLRIYDLYQAAQGQLDFLMAQEDLAPGMKINNLGFLLGGLSLLVADDGGTVAQWFWQPNEGQYALFKVREFAGPSTEHSLFFAEQRRKAFGMISDKGQLRLISPTAERVVLDKSLGLTNQATAVAMSPRADFLLIEDAARRFHLWGVDNPHPEMSFSALWDEVWYESYSEPEYVWQSSASNNDFEPKYSFSPLAFGTLKAAFYSMLLAAPLAICGAVFTAYFMAPAMRKKIKPLIELMEALPTVILGFLAGLWLAPFVEKHLPAIFAIFILLPIVVLLAAYCWTRLPTKVRQTVPDGWQAGLLIPVVCVVGYGSVSMNQPVELMFFGGDARHWLTNSMGVSFDQRNALIVGVAMGFAVIPTIFSIAEDAIFSVPRHLTNGSLALGATPWQTMIRVVLPTASPGIFSALMIGMGRAVGETMIVLMATGNTPIMDANIFEGMRTLAANIAVEVPEAEVDSTHYRVLFLAAFVLFMFTFVVNTMAELVRQSLREKYGSL